MWQKFRWFFCSLSLKAPHACGSLTFFPKQHLRVKVLYCQEWEIDQLLEFCRRNFILLIFAWFFKAKYSTKICPS